MWSTSDERCKGFLFGIMIRPLVDCFKYTILRLLSFKTIRDPKSSRLVKNNLEKLSCI